MSIGIRRKSQNSRRIDTQEAAINLDLEITTDDGRDFPWKHLEFISFQIVHMVAKKEACQSSLLLWEPNTNFQVPKKYSSMCAFRSPLIVFPLLFLLLARCLSN
eukprot:TRINITY_DN40104_c1_g2_i2.p1 TRINITY_DN40104_c1_g2~~TRINITY_DN40104_c1_g2_i2.p1  ORF type:complete len:104 (-),score=8.70 TRINITY_DN40104_c1_g2_i2:167-478(-)